MARLRHTCRESGDCAPQVVELETSEGEKSAKGQQQMMLGDRAPQVVEGRRRKEVKQERPAKGPQQRILEDWIQLGVSWIQWPVSHEHESQWTLTRKPKGLSTLPITSALLVPVSQSRGSGRYRPAQKLRGTRRPLRAEP